ncbi:MAG: MFS transporter [Acetobacteraceae bacterium]|nr:MFS transporter [Acetobacteraceae bacterium]MSP31064.1 MFS transporter [Acetobacteraceae bacterium]
MLTTMNRRLTIILGVTQTLAWATTFYMPTVLTAAVAHDLGVSSTALLGGFSWSLLIAGLASPNVGRWIDQHGGRNVLIASSVVLALGLVVMAGMPTLVGWYLGWSITGIGMALGLYDAAFATIGRLLGLDARPVIVGVTLIAGLASTLGWPMGVALVDVLGWRHTLLIYAAINILINLPLNLFAVPRAIPDHLPLPTAPQNGGRASQGGAGSIGVAMVLLSIFFSIRAALSAIFAVHTLTLFHGIGLGAIAAVATASLMGPSQVFGRILEWGFKRWLDPLAASRIGALLLPLGVACLFLGSPAALFMVLYGMSNGILTISRGTLPMHLFGAHSYATRLGLLALPPLICQALAPTLAAPLVADWPAQYIFIAMGLSALLAMLCLLPLRRAPKVD